MRDGSNNVDQINSWRKLPFRSSNKLIQFLLSKFLIGLAAIAVEESAINYVSYQRLLTQLPMSCEPWRGHLSESFNGHAYFTFFGLIFSLKGQIMRKNCTGRPCCSREINAFWLRDHESRLACRETRFFTSIWLANKLLKERSSFEACLSITQAASYFFHGRFVKNL